MNPTLLALEQACARCERAFACHVCDLLVMAAAAAEGEGEQEMAAAVAVVAQVTLSMSMSERPLLHFLALVLYFEDC